METRGVPDIPDVLAEQAAPYLQVRPVSFQDWQLKGTNATILISQRPPKGEVSQLHVFNKPKGPAATGYFWSGAGAGSGLEPGE